MLEDAAVSERFARQENDLATKFSRVEDDIRREKDLNAAVKMKQIENEFGGDSTAAIDNINYYLNTFGYETGSVEHQKVTKAIMLGSQKQKDYSDLKLKIAEQITETNMSGDPNEFRSIYGVPPRVGQDGKKIPLDNQDLEYILFVIKSSGFSEERSEELKDGGRIGYKVGGRVGYAEGDLVGESPMLEEKEAPIVMNYTQLRSKLPEFIQDDVVSLIAYSPNAFKDFAIINNQGDVDEFNTKYDVRLELPDADRMDFSAAKEKVSPAVMPITVPSAIPAQPTVATQMGTGTTLSPTEVALLSPTEQAIRMRNR